MDRAGRILAINIDPQAPVFSYAHYGIVGDLVEVIPKLIAAIRREGRAGSEIPRGARTDSESAGR